MREIHEKPLQRSVVHVEWFPNQKEFKKKNEIFINNRYDDPDNLNRHINKILQTFIGSEFFPKDKSWYNNTLGNDG